MTGLEIWLLAIGLAMDCFAVSIASGIILKRVRMRPMLIMALAFGFFQALMPLLGWIGASFFSHLIENIDHWIAFAILAFLGGRMVLESFKDEDCRHEFDPTSLKVVSALAVATSIDALGSRCFICISGCPQFFIHTAFYRHHRICIICLIICRTDVRYPFRMWHCPQITRGTLGWRHPYYHRHKDIDRAPVLQLISRIESPKSQ